MHVSCIKLIHYNRTGSLEGPVKNMLEPIPILHILSPEPVGLVVKKLRTKRPGINTLHIKFYIFSFYNLTLLKLDIRVGTFFRFSFSCKLCYLFFSAYYY